MGSEKQKNKPKKNVCQILKESQNLDQEKWHEVILSSFIFVSLRVAIVMAVIPIQNLQNSEKKKKKSQLSILLEKSRGRSQSNKSH